MEGKIPITGFINLENTGEDQWRLFFGGVLGKNFETTGIINQKENSQGKIRLRISIDQIVPPEYKFFETKTTFRTTLEGCSIGLSRIDTFLGNFLYDSAWVFLGRVNGKDEKPIIICYFPAINKSLYSLKLIDEDKDNFLPHLMN